MNCMYIKRTFLVALMAMFLFSLGAYAKVETFPTSITGDASSGFVVNWQPNQSKTLDSDNTDSLGLVALGCAQAHLNAGGTCKVTWKLKSDGKYKIEITLNDGDPIEIMSSYHFFTH